MCLTSNANPENSNTGMFIMHAVITKVQINGLNAKFVTFMYTYVMSAYPKINLPLI